MPGSLVTTGNPRPRAGATRRRSNGFAPPPLLKALYNGLRDRQVTHDQTNGLAQRLHHRRLRGEPINLPKILRFQPHDRRYQQILPFQSFAGGSRQALELPWYNQAATQLSRYIMAPFRGPVDGGHVVQVASDTVLSHPSGFCSFVAER